MLTCKRGKTFDSSRIEFFDGSSELLCLILFVVQYHLNFLFGSLTRLLLTNSKAKAPNVSTSVGLYVSNSLLEFLQLLQRASVPNP